MTPDDPRSLHRLLYRSRSAITGSDAAVETGVEGVLESSRRNNARDGVTGALMFTSSMFIQALEGPRDRLETTFERICCDLRHLEVEIIEYSPVDERAFGAWSMHQVQANPAVEMLFLQLNGEGVGDVDISAAAAQAVSLMRTLVELEEGAEAGVARAA